MALNKLWLLQEWRELADQHFRAGNATMYYACLRHVTRIYNAYLKW